jgi:hypothetical protein
VTKGPQQPSARIEREKSALLAHRAALRGSTLPPPDDAPKGTFVHGFFLPFSLIAATLRDPELRPPYVRVVALRAVVVVLVGIVAIAGGNVRAREHRHDGIGVVVHRSPGHEKPAAVHVDLPGLKVDIDDKEEKAAVSVLGQTVPVQGVEPAHAQAPSDEPAPPSGLLGRAWGHVAHSWAWLLALFTFLSATEGVIVFFSRRWDDWLSFHASRLAAIRPEDDAPKTPKLAVDLGWLYRKLKRRLRGYVVFGAGLPALLPLRLVPTIGGWLFTIAATMWGWYWLGVFSAAKSAHAWADEERALSPAPIRSLNERLSSSTVFAPLRWYGRAWARITSSVNPAATTFERSPAAFLGLALARVVLAFPGLYLLARPIVPVAAGRLCAEADPAARFTAVPRECSSPVPQRV